MLTLETNNREGVLDVDYHKGRKTKRALRYRLNRRTREVLKAINTYRGIQVDNLLDIGTADAFMLDILCHNLTIRTPIGLDFSADLLAKAPNKKNLNLVQADAISLPFKGDSIDIIMAISVIGSIPEPETTIDECYRILKTNGICILTWPDPFFVRIGILAGHLEEKNNLHKFNLILLRKLFEQRHFKILDAYKFMISPIGFPYELSIERLINKMGLGCLLSNQMIIAMKC